MQALKQTLKQRAPLQGENILSLSPFLSLEDGAPYAVWKVTTEKNQYVCKRAGTREAGVYQQYLATLGDAVPKLIDCFTFDGQNYLLLEYITGNPLSHLDQASLKAALDALISIQEAYWGRSEIEGCGTSFAESLLSRKKRGEYLGDATIEAGYVAFLSAYEILPRTLTHDDLLPFNILVGEGRAVLLDWEHAGILPYPTSLARLLAHGTPDADALFFLTEKDKAYAIQYYYEHLVKRHGIPYSDYQKAMDLALLYEYCEWIMLYHRYPDADPVRYAIYRKKALDHLAKMEKV